MYKNFAYLYDTLAQFNYENWLNKAFAILNSYNAPKELGVDLACGTGELTKLMCEKGIDCIGVDRSADMLNVAKNKSEALFLLQDMTAFELYGTVDIIFCACDSVNYILSHKKMQNMFWCISNYLNYKGMFIFDFNTKYKYENILSMNSYILQNNDVYCGWQNEYDKNTEICKMYLDFFVKQGDVYKRFHETHKQRAYTPQYFTDIANGFNLTVCEIIDENGKTVSNHTQRILIAVQKN